MGRGSHKTIKRAGNLDIKSGASFRDSAFALYLYEILSNFSVGTFSLNVRNPGLVWAAIFFSSWKAFDLCHQDQDCLQIIGDL